MHCSLQLASDLWMAEVAQLLLCLHLTLADLRFQPCCWADMRHPLHEPPMQLFDCAVCKRAFLRVQRVVTAVLVDTACSIWGDPVIGFCVPRVLAHR